MLFLYNPSRSKRSGAVVIEHPVLLARSSRDFVPVTWRFLLSTYHGDKQAG